MTHPQLKPTDEEIREAFELTVQAIYSDMMQACVDMGEEFLMDREDVFGYVSMYGGSNGERVYAYLLETPHGQFDNELDEANVPKYWS